MQSFPTFSAFVEPYLTDPLLPLGRLPQQVPLRYLKGLIAVHFKLPTKTVFLSIGPFEEKVEFQKYAAKLVEMGFSLYASKNTADFLKERS